MTFCITNRPSWATFNASTGVLSGMPVSTNVGTTSGVIISVSDGVSSASLPAFSVTVNAISVTAIRLGTATLSWVAPTKRQDGSPFSLSDLRGYKVYEGAAAITLAPAVNITTPTTTSYTISNLALGTHYFTVTAYDTAGAESNYSTVVSKIIK